MTARIWSAATLASGCATAGGSTGSTVTSARLRRFTRACTNVPGGRRRYRSVPMDKSHA
ncbi:MAG TPA: hypothetical protein VGD83_14545 [Streptosporangiaceae bacterium]